MTTPQDVRSQLRRRLRSPAQRTYWLIEFDGLQPPRREPFFAPSDEVALERAIDVAEGEIFEVWEGERLVRRWTASRAPGRSFTPR